MHLFAALSGLEVMGSNKALIHLFITGGGLTSLLCTKALWCGPGRMETMMQISRWFQVSIFVKLTQIPSALQDLFRLL